MPAGVTVMPAGVTGVNRSNDYAARHEPAYRYATRHIELHCPLYFTVSAANTFIVEHFLRSALISSTTAQRQWHSIKSSMEKKAFFCLISPHTQEINVHVSI